MSDLFTNLAARSLGKAAVVRPRVPSLFEPAGPVIAAWQPESPAEDISRQSESESARSESVSVQERPVQGRAPHVESLTTAPLQEGPSAPVRMQPTSLPTKIRREEPAASGPHHAIDRVEVGPHISAQTTPTPEVTAGFRAAPRHSAISESLPIASAKPALQQTATPAAGHTSRRNPSPPQDVVSQLAELFRDDAPEVAVDASSQPAFVQQGEKGARRAQSNQSIALHGSATPASHESTVQVTIGRVEVRAIFPEAGPQQVATRPGPKTLSLDDYLTGRSRGTR